MDSSSGYKSEATGMTNWEYQDGRHGRLLLVANCQTDMTLFILILILGALQITNNLKN